MAKKTSVRRPRQQTKGRKNPVATGARARPPVRRAGLTFRDPIHRDITVGPVQAAIIDTPIFQRLRYIRQTGLLHFVFPGAVHTRFAHSIGTMHLAQRVFRSLFPGHRHADTDDRRSALRYVGTVFETAALLHDVGHCAFSHAIEAVSIEGKPLLGPIGELVAAWADPCLTRWWEQKPSALTIPKRTAHEHIGLLMMTVLLGGHRYPNIADIIKHELEVEPGSFADDVRAIVGGELPPSEYFRECASNITGGPSAGVTVPPETRAEDLLFVLHSLVSGTLDVDRMDYLLRDSLHTGAPYGIYDLDVLVNSIAVHASDGDFGPHLDLALWSRAVGALDDMLWSRYQLFSQVLNHKTNVMLNALLAAEAIPQAFADVNKTGLGPPRDLDDFVQFTDDRVMSAIIRACLGKTSPDRAYARALFSRELPLHLGTLPLSGKNNSRTDKRATDARRAALAGDLGVPAAAIREWKARSDLVKGGGLPWVLRKSKIGGEVEMHALGGSGGYQIIGWTDSKRLPAKVELMHFFVDRGAMKPQGGKPKK
ncbi:MAG: HD domain-containing protein [Polyangiaceae bacterium]